jgi:hypothetical protein
MSAFYRTSGARKRHGTMQLQHRSDDSAALDEGAILKLGRTACCGSACVFITIGPYQAMAPEAVTTKTSSNRIPSSLAGRASLPLLKGDE